MSPINTKELSSGFQKTPIHKDCHKCGSSMAEVDRCHENNVLFIWYTCDQKGCHGQWLEKR